MQNGVIVARYGRPYTWEGPRREMLSSGMYKTTPTVDGAPCGLDPLTTCRDSVDHTSSCACK